MGQKFQLTFFAPPSNFSFSPFQPLINILPLVNFCQIAIFLFIFCHIAKMTYFSSILPGCQVEFFVLFARLPNERASSLPRPSWSRSTQRAGCWSRWSPSSSPQELFSSSSGCHRPVTTWRYVLLQAIYFSLGQRT